MKASRYTKLGADASGDLDDAGENMLGLSRYVASKFASARRGRDGDWDEWWAQAFISGVRMREAFRFKEGNCFRAHALHWLPKKLGWHRHKEYGGHFTQEHGWKYVNSACYQAAHARRRRGRAYQEPLRDERIDPALQVVETLPLNLWEPLSLLVRGLTIRQTADSLGVSHYAARERTRGALKAVRDRLGIGKPAPRAIPQSGVPGVLWCSFTKRWRGSFKVDRKTFNTKRFDTIEEAAAAVRDLRLLLGVPA